MKATTIHAPYDVRLSDVPEPQLVAPADAVVRVSASCVCGSDLWRYRGINDITEGARIGHEFVGVVEEVGAAVTTVRPGQFVIAPFTYSDGTCPHCVAGMHSACRHGGNYGLPDEDGHLVDGCQGEYVRVPQADGTLVSTPEPPDDALVPDLLALSDVMGTGWHAAVCAGVKPGHTVVVVGDGAVGLSGVLAAQRLGAGRVVAMSRHASRQAVAREFGATDVIAERGEDAIQAVLELTDGVGADAVLECVGTEESMSTSIDCARAGATVGYVGMPHSVELPIRSMFTRNVGLVGGVAPARAYLPRLRDEVLSGAITPGRVFDLDLPLAEVAEGYAAMDERRAIKSLLRP